MSINITLSLLLLCCSLRAYFATVYGAISHCLNKSVFMMAKSTNTVDFKKFLTKVVKEVKIEYRGSKRAVLVCDNHGAHIAKANKEFIEREFYPLYMPAHSSPFNSIERVWAVAKNNFAQLSLHNYEELKYEEFVNMVLQSCTMISQNVIKNLCNANRAHVLKFLLEKERL